LAEYDVVISEMALSDYSSSLDDFLDYVRSGGDDNNYIWAVYDDPRLTEAINEGLVWDLSSLGFYSDQFEFFKKNRLCEKYTMGDGVYAMNAKPDISYAGLYVNRDVLIQCGVDVDVIWTMQEEGTWNWEAFENVLAQIDASGEDVYGLVADDTFMTAAIHSNGAVLVAREGDEYVDASCTEGAHKAIEWVDGIYEKYAFSLPENEKYTDAFLGGKVAFCAGNSFDCVDNGWMSRAQIDYSFIAFPMGPDVNYYANCENSIVYVIPGCYDDGKAFEIAYAFELWMTEPGGYDEYINLKQFQKCDKSILDTMIFLSRNTKTIIDYADMVLVDTAE